MACVEMAVSCFACFGSSQMQSSQIASHLVAIGAGAWLSQWLGGSSRELVCPACALSCGGCSCPQVVCTTGHIELSAVLAGLIICFLIFGVIILRWRLASNQDIGHQGKGSFDGRRPALGTSTAYRPAQG